MCTSPTREKRTNTLKNVQNDREAHDKSQKNTCRLLEEISIQNWDLAAEPNVQVLADTLNEVNKRGDCMKHWLMLQDYTTLNTMYRKTPQKQTTFISPKGHEKQIDFILTKRRYLKYNKDAEANDMIHMGSDHRCVMATFMITTPKKSSLQDKKKENYKK